jgi:hypothetical protein
MKTEDEIINNFKLKIKYENRRWGVVSEGMTQSNDFACRHLLEQIFRKSCIFSIEATNVQCSKSN